MDYLWVRPRPWRRLRVWRVGEGQQADHDGVAVSVLKKLESEDGSQERNSENYGWVWRADEAVGVEVRTRWLG